MADPGPAKKAGLRGGRTGTATGIEAGGDLIVEVDGQKTSSPEDVSAAIADDQPGDTVRVTYYRGNDRRTDAGRARQAPGRLRRGRLRQLGPSP